jgi:hypothetical protein
MAQKQSARHERWTTSCKCRNPRTTKDRIEVATIDDGFSKIAGNTIKDDN